MNIAQLSQDFEEAERSADVDVPTLLRDLSAALTDGTVTAHELNGHGPREAAELLYQRRLDR